MHDEYYLFLIGIHRCIAFAAGYLLNGDGMVCILWGRPQRCPFARSSTSYKQSGKVGNSYAFYSCSE